MNQQVRCMLILMGAFFFAQWSSAQPAQTASRELIVQVPGIDGTRGFPEIRTKLINIQGVHVVAFCETQDLIMMKIEKKKQAENKPVFDAISELEFKFYVKEGATISKAMQTCKDKKLVEFPYDDLPGE